VKVNGKDWHRETDSNGDDDNIVDKCCSGPRTDKQRGNNNGTRQYCSL